MQMCAFLANSELLECQNTQIVNMQLLDVQKRLL